MTINEFKAWLEGFSESFNGDAPTKNQWEKIKAKIAALGALPLALGGQHTWINRPNQNVTDGTIQQMAAAQLNGLQPKLDGYQSQCLGGRDLP